MFDEQRAEEAKRIESHIYSLSLNKQFYKDVGKYEYYKERMKYYKNLLKEYKK